MRCRFRVGLVVLAVTACAGDEPEPVCGCNLAAQTPVVVANVADPTLEEISGVVASATHDVLWVIEDSGNPAQVVAISPDGSTRAVLTLLGASNIDWEDLALGPCAAQESGDCLWVADIGDKAQSRASIRAFVFPEPEPATASVTPTEVVWTYPDSAHNAEAFVVTGEGQIQILTKRNDGAFQTFHGDATGGVLTGGETTSIGGALPIVTGADFDADTGRLLVRTYGSVWEYGVDGVAVELPAPVELQGEAVAYASGCGYVTIGEAVQPEIHSVSCL